MRKSESMGHARRTPWALRATAFLLVVSCGLLWSWTATVLSFSFDLPATALASQNPPYPSVATLTLTETADGVQFVLDPNEASAGFGSSSFVERLDIVYSGDALAGGDFRNDAGVAGSFSFESNPNNMDAGYAAADSHIVVDFPSGTDNFDPTEMSTWTVLGATLADFATSASANSKPSPIFGVISVSAYSLPGVTPTPSNWVAVIPEPGTALLLLAGLAGLGWKGRPRTW